MRFKNQFTALATAAVMTAFFGMAACNKDKKTAADNDTGYGTDQAMAERNFDDVQSISDQAATNGSLSTYKTGGGTILGNCSTVTRDTAAHTVTIDFGTTNCLGNDGNYRRGQIIVTYSGHYADSGSVHNISLNNYFVNDNAVTGSKTVTNTGHNAAGQPTFNVSVNGAVTLASGAGTITWVSTRTRTWTAGYNTTAWADDAYDIAGSGTLTRANGNVCAVSITTPLHIALGCTYRIESGTVQITPQNGNVRTLDFGAGACDDSATLSVNGNTYNISIH